MEKGRGTPNAACSDKPQKRYWRELQYSVNQIDKQPNPPKGFTTKTDCSALQCKELVTTCCSLQAARCCRVHPPNALPALIPPLLQRRTEWHLSPTSKSLFNNHQSQIIIRLKDFTGQGNKIIILNTTLPIKCNTLEYFQAIISNSVLLQCMVSVKIRSLLSVQQRAVCSYFQVPFKQ